MAVDASTLDVGNMLDFSARPEYFTANVQPSYFSISYYWSTCGGGAASTDPIFIDYSGGCFWFYQSIAGFYMDYSAFSGAAVAISMTAENMENGQISPTAGVDEIQGAAEEVVDIDIGGWQMEEVLGATGEHTDPDVRRTLEVFWSILGIGRANAAEAQTEEAPQQTARSFGTVYITGHPVWGVFPIHTALEYVSAVTPRTTISAGPYPAIIVGPYLRSGINRPTDLLNMTLGTVSDPGNPVPELYFAELLVADSHYDDDLLYHVWGAGGSLYNSNGYTNGLMIATGGTPSIDMNRFVGAEYPVPQSAFQ
jgi:hypothetical protein